MSYSLSNKCAKNLCKRTVLVQFIIKNGVTCFFGTQCRMACLPDGDKMKICLLVSREYTNVTDEQTDGHTDTSRRHWLRLRIA